MYKGVHKKLKITMQIQETQKLLMDALFTLQYILK